MPIMPIRAWAQTMGTVASPYQTSKSNFNTKSLSNKNPQQFVRLFGRLSKAEIQDRARSLSLPLTITKKESRERILRRLAQHVATLPAQQQARILSELGIKSDPQTDGWIRVISEGK